jgi:heavy metal efflux system protein
LIRKVVDFALNNQLLVLAAAVLVTIWGVISFHNLPVEAYPDIANDYVQIITQWQGRAAEEVEQQVTIPIEIAVNSIPHLQHMRSISMFGLSNLILTFDDDSENDWNRQKVLERLSQAELPDGLTPQIGTDFSPVGEIFMYTLESTNPQYDLMELNALEAFTLEKQFRAVPDVVDVSSFGGTTKEYQVQIDPDKLVSYGLTLSQVEQQLANNNSNSGGNFVEVGMQQVNVREVGLIRTVDDIRKIVLKAQNGTPLRMGDIATIEQGTKIRLGRIGKAVHRADGKIVDDDDVVEGVILLRKGAYAEPTLKAINLKIKALNDHVLPPGVKVVPFLDRSYLLHDTTHTVLHNLTEGFILVSIVLFLFLGSLRSAMIVALTIPFALLFASICLDLRHIPANLLSLGALDFGMVVDGAVVMVDNILRHLVSDQEAPQSIPQRIRAAAHEVQRPVFYAITIIVTAYLPIFTLQQVEGRLFRPMAWTVAFALLGALAFSIVIAPVLAALLFRRLPRERRNPVLGWITAGYRRALTWTVHHRWVMVGAAVTAVCCSLWLLTGARIGSEFLPHLDEGAIWLRGTSAPSTGLTSGTNIMDRTRILLASYPEVTQVVAQVGRPDDGTDTTGFSNTEYYVDLKPKEEWRPKFHRNKEEVISDMDGQLQKLPGVVWGFSQPIADDMDEAMSGVKGELAVKIYGDDLKILEEKADEMVDIMRTVPGINDLGLFRVTGQPNLDVTVDRDAAARFQINVADVQDAIQTAVGGNAVSEVLQGEQRFDLVARYSQGSRDTREGIEHIRLLSPSGERVSLAQLCTIQIKDGASQLYRESNSRYVAIRYSVRGRDLGGTVEEAMRKINERVNLPPLYSIVWAGEYESQKRAEARLMIIVPTTVFLIFLIIYAAFGSAKWACLHLVNVAVARVGGLLALYITSTHFSVSSGVGFLALFGASVQTGVIMVEYINQLRAGGYSIESAAIEGATRRLRPIMMTMLVATLGLLPAALSHSVGSDSQRPFAIVIVGGLIVDLIMSTFLLPTFYVWWARPTDRLPSVA